MSAYIAEMKLVAQKVARALVSLSVLAPQSPRDVLPCFLSIDIFLEIPFSVALPPPILSDPD